MSVVKINFVTVPEHARSTFEERFKGRAGAVETTEGFEWFELLRPQGGPEEPYIVYTRWASEDAYEAWYGSQQFDRAHDGGGDTLAPAASGSHVGTYDVLESSGPKGSTPHQEQ
jgi:heme-degrading monooxygenase HmoA